MAEIRIFYKDEEGKIKMSRSIETMKSVPMNQFLWIDLNDVTVEVESELEQLLKIYIQEEEEMTEIEISSRYMETTDSMVVNSQFLLDDYEEETVSFIIKNGILISVRDKHLRSFNEVVKKIFASPKNFQSGYSVLVDLLATRVDYDADMIEEVAREITSLSNEIKNEDDASNDALMAVKELQEKTMIIRENIVDKQRVCSNILKSVLMPRDEKAKLTIIVKDINSLFEHTRFSFDRLEYLQDAVIGLINIQQNKIIKIFTIVSVIFMPPTLVASIYGMNFTKFPSLDWEHGVLFSIVVMIACVVAILLYFKQKKWL